MPDLQDIRDLRGDLDEDTLITNVRRDNQASEDMLQANVYQTWQDSIKHWKGEHLETPKAGRSKLFLRKPRNTAERIKAGLLEAFFSGEDYAAVEPARENVVDDVLGAKIRQAYINYRLSGKPIPWFQICYSAFDDLTVHNVCIARVEWILQKDNIPFQAPIMNPLMGQPMIDEMGQPMMEDRMVELTVRDEPFVTLVPPERIRIDPRISWIDPATAQYQYLIEHWFPTLQELVKLAETDPLIDLENVELTAREQYNDTIQTERYSGGTPHMFDEFDRQQIEVWRYWYKVGSTWWYAWTGADRHVIRKPQKNPYAHGKTGYVFGFITPESHLFYSDGPLAIHKDYFTAINGIRNQRFDNVAAILNKHAIVSRDARVDLASIVNRRPGGVTVVEGDVNKAMRWDEIPDIAASGYNEEILLDRELAEGTGIAEGVGQGVGPAKGELATQTLIKQQQANKKEAMTIRIVAATFIVPTIELVIALADQFETDQQVLSIVGATIGLAESDDMIPNLMDIKGQYSVKVNAGLGALSGEIKLQRLDVAIARISQLYGPMAVLPLFREYLPLLGVKNVKEVLEAIQSSNQLMQLLQVLQGQGGREPKQNGQQRGRPAPSATRPQMPNEGDLLRRVAGGRASEAV